MYGKPSSLLLGLYLACTGASADLGRLEINQVCALDGGCFEGDDPGFPVVISKPGSYVLTGNLSHDPIVHGAVQVILLSTSDVQIDLNGFTVHSTATCTEVSCPFSGGPAIDAILKNRVSVRNGNVRGFGSDCIRLGKQARVDDVSISECAASGIAVLSGGVIHRATIASTGRNGLSAGPGTIYSASTFRDSGLRNDLNGAIDLRASVSKYARASGANSCDDGLCGDGRPRYYLTPTEVAADRALTHCDQGFHMASLREIRHTSALLYDEFRGRTSADSGSGPPNTGLLSNYGWIRTGGSSRVTSPSPFSVSKPNCALWTSADSEHRGTAVGLSNTFGGEVDGWSKLETFCAHENGVWCMED